MLYITLPTNGNTETRWATRVVKSKMQWIQPTEAELAANNTLTLHKDKVAVSSEYTVIRPDGTKLKVFPLNDFGLGKDTYIKAIETAAATK